LPTYTYVCTVCGAGIERRQSFSDAPLTICESCSGALRRVVHPVGVIFKGSGFYNTDYKNKATGNGNGAKEDGDAKPAENKPADAPAASSSNGEAGAAPSTSSTPTSASSKPSGSGRESGAPAAAGKT
jgi:putative FmdB family regulatory protein